MDKDTIKVVKRLVIDLVVFLVLFALTFWFVFRGQDPEEIKGALGQADFRFILLGVGFMMIYFTVEAWNIRSILKSFGDKISLPKALKFTFINFFFCSISPGASGGQPMEIYYMTKEKIPGAHATLAILIQTCGIQLAVMFLGILCMAMSPIEISGIVLTLFIVGLIINGVALLVLALSIFSNETVRGIVNGAMKLLRKFGVKKVGEWQKGINKSLDEYAEGSKYIQSHVGEFLVAMVRSVVQMACYYLVPYCIYKSFGLSGQTIWQLFAMQSIVFM